MAALNDCFISRDFWRLQPLLKAVTTPAGKTLPRNQIVVAGTERNDLLVAYVPDDRAVGLTNRVLPARANASWLNPRTGATVPANPVGGNGAYNFATPGPGDWLLIVSARK